MMLGQEEVDTIDPRPQPGVLVLQLSSGLPDRQLECFGALYRTRKGSHCLVDKFDLLDLILRLVKMKLCR